MKTEVVASSLQPIVKTEILTITQGTLEGSNATLVLNDQFAK